MASVVANEGGMMRPWLVRNIKDVSGRILYEAEPILLASPIETKTSEDLRILMHDTYTCGTGRKSYQRLHRKRIFKDIELGAKTGTINDQSDQFRYDWLVAYALPRDREGVCIAVLGVHDKILGIRSSELARHILNYYLT